MMTQQLLERTEHVVDNTAGMDLPPVLFEALVAAWAELLVADFRRRRTRSMATQADCTSKWVAVSG